MMIEVANVTKYFGPVLAVDQISFQVDQGEIVGFLGLNGAGKTTTLRILTSYLPATSGVAKVAGFDVMTESMDVRKNIGYLPESVPLYQEMRVEEYLAFRAKLKGVDRQSRQSRIDYCLDRCRIREVRRRLIGTLSKGYRQRVGLADAMVHDPKILILDEPTVGLDPLQIREIRRLIKSFAGEHTVILSTHILAEVTMTCHRVLIIHEGRIAAEDTLERLAARGERTRRLSLRLARPDDGVETVLQAVPGVLGARRDDDGGYLVECGEGQDAREAIAAIAVSRGWGLLELRPITLSLEETFIRIIRGEAA